MNTIPLHESLTCEFNSDRQCLSDKDLIEAVVCMANCQGGEIYLGVEEDGTVTGLRAFEWVETLFKPLKTEQEFQSGLLRWITGHSARRLPMRLRTGITACAGRCIQHEQMVKSYVDQHGRIIRQEVIELCRLTPDQAYKLLKRLSDEKLLKKTGC